MRCDKEWGASDFMGDGLACVVASASAGGV